MIAGVLLAMSITIQAPCGDYKELIGLLTSRFKEFRVNRAIVGTGVGMLETYVSSKGLWTMIIVSPTGLACVLSAGENWTETKVKETEL